LPRPRVLALILAGGEGGRLDLLTEERPKPVLPFAGVYRLIDVVLSNCTHSGISDVWVLQQYQAHPLSEHLTNGRPWDLDRTRGGLRIVHPFLGRRESGWYRGNADAIHRNRAAIRAFHPDVLLTLSADHVYRLDYATVVGEHVDSGAAVTMVTTTVAREAASRFGVVRVDGSGRVSGYDHKPKQPRGETVATEVFAFEPGILLELLDGLAEEGDGPGDLGDVVLPRLVQSGRARAHALDGYWRDVGTVDAYWECHQELLGDRPPIDLDDREWPVLTRAPARHASARVLPDASVSASMLAPGAEVAGTVQRSVISRGAVVERGAVVRESVLLPGAIVRSGAQVVRSVVDDGVQIGRDARIGADGGEIALVGLRARVDDGHVVPGGGRFPG
jgi:glucose-1-phosphate adenylyltransferase